MSEIRYKLTNQNMQTYHEFQWELGKKYVIENDKDALCGGGFFHFYCHPLLAILHNPIHIQLSNPRLFKAKVSGKNKTDGQLKEGWKKATLIEEIPIPEITIKQKIRYGILCVLEVYNENSFVEWANNWLSGKDRSRAAARASADAAVAAAQGTAAAAAAAYAAAAAAAQGTEAAAAAAYAAAAAQGTEAAAAAAYAAAAAQGTAAAYAAAMAADGAKNIYLIKIAEKAINDPNQ